MTLPRTVVLIEERDGVLTAKLDRTDLAIAEARKSYPLACDPAKLPPLDSPQNVQAYGESLRQALMQHPAIGDMLKILFKTPIGQSRTLCFQIQATGVEQIRWEVLSDEQGKFVALDGRCRIGRIADEATTQDFGARPFTPPLKIAAFLSAAGVDAGAEWKGLSTALTSARGAGVPVELRVYVGQQELLDEINAERAQGLHAGVAALPMPDSGIGVERVLNDWRPQIVHFFCHGSTGYGVPYLEMATILEHDQQLALGSVILRVDDLVSLEARRDAWIMVLNCCEGAQAAGELYSMAFRLVADGGMPAAIGMLKPVTAGDANAFSENLYPELFRLLGNKLKAAVPGAGQVGLDLTEVIGASRRALRNKYLTMPSNSERWTLPVLYLHREPLNVLGLTASGLSTADVDDLRQRAETVAGFLRDLPPDTPEELRDTMLATLEKRGVPAELRPDRMGRFAQS